MFIAATVLGRMEGEAGGSDPQHWCWLLPCSSGPPGSVCAEGSQGVFTCPSPNGYKKQVDLRFRESLPTLAYAEHFCCVLLFKMPSKRAGAHMPREPAMWLGRLAQPGLCNRFLMSSVNSSSFWSQLCCKPGNDGKGRGVLELMDLLSTCFKHSVGFRFCVLCFVSSIFQSMKRVGAEALSRVWRTWVQVRQSWVSVSVLTH